VIRPGLAKARGLPLVLTRRGTFVRAPDPRWRQLFERADAVSEGSVREEDAGRVWYGSTSLILSIDPAEACGADHPLLAALARRDLHVRLRAVRIAHREACARSPCRLGRFTCEMRVESDARGVRIDVDVQAPLIETRAYWKSAR
jgi:hypothetical protein